jgi:hypothetical protein
MRSVKQSNTTNGTDPGLVAQYDGLVRGGGYEALSQDDQGLELTAHPHND